MKRTTEEWLRAMRYDVDTADVLLQNKRYIYSVFLSVQMIEKALKAIWSEERAHYPPRSHNLIKLAKLLNIWKKLSNEQRKFIAYINPMYIAIRYPDAHVAVEDSLDYQEAEDILSRAKEVCTWLTDRLN